jgi:hypothetical protein
MPQPPPSSNVYTAPSTPKRTLTAARRSESSHTHTTGTSRPRAVTTPRACHPAPSHPTTPISPAPRTLNSPAVTTDPTAPFPRRPHTSHSPRPPQPAPAASDTNAPPLPPWRHQCSTAAALATPMLHRCRPDPTLTTLHPSDTLTQPRADHLHQRLPHTASTATLTAAQSSQQHCAGAASMPHRCRCPGDKTAWRRREVGVAGQESPRYRRQDRANAVVADKQFL